MRINTWSRIRFGAVTRHPLTTEAPKTGFTILPVTKQHPNSQTVICRYSGRDNIEGHYPVSTRPYGTQVDGKSVDRPGGPYKEGHYHLTDKDADEYSRFFVKPSTGLALAIPFVEDLARSNPDEPSAGQLGLEAILENLADANNDKGSLLHCVVEKFSFKAKNVRRRKN